MANRIAEEDVLRLAQEFFVRHGPLAVERMRDRINELERARDYEDRDLSLRLLTLVENMVADAKLGEQS